MTPKYVTELEAADIEAVLKYGSYQEAAKYTGRSVRAITESFYRVRNKYTDMKSDCNWIESMRRKLGPKRRLLTS